MATTSFSKSLKYGGRLFVTFLAVFLVGGGFVGAGAYLAVPELLAYRASGSLSTTTTGGGAVLVLVGLATLLAGNFALAYKLIADAVSRGTADEPAVVEMGTDADESGTAAAESDTAAAETTASPVADGSSTTDTRSGVDDEPDAGAYGPSRAASSGPATASTADGTAPREEAGERPATEAEPPTGEPAAETGTQREQTAEEIAFGTPREPAAEDDADAPDVEEEPVDRTGSTAEGTETAGTGSSDPLAERFDDE